jgi:hypothetical protein
MALPKTIPIAELSIPPYHLTWEVPPVPESAGPEQLAGLIESFRDRIRELRREHNTGITSIGGLSRDGLTKLVKLAYQASLLTDEGRRTIARLVVNDENPDALPKEYAPWLPADIRATAPQVMQQYWQRQEHRLNAIRFSAPRKLDRPATIAKLSSVLNNYDSAIAVAEQGESLVVTGLGMLDPSEVERPLFVMPRHFLANAGFVLDILGPAHLRVRDGKVSFTLVGDRLTVYGDVLSVEQVRQWLTEFSEAMVARLVANREYAPESSIVSQHESTVETTGRCPHHDVSFPINRMLRESIRMRHGGAFAVLPDVLSALKDGHLRDIAYRIVPLDLGEELFSAWLAVCRVWTAMKGHPELQNVVNSQRLAIRRWLSLLRTVGGMSAADGCVVVDRNLVVHGFGGSINADKMDGGRDRICRNTTTNQDVRAGDLLDQFGQRHRAAYALCANVSGSLVFVVSQDGDLRIFSSDTEKVYFATDILPPTA